MPSGSPEDSKRAVLPKLVQVRETLSFIWKILCIWEAKSLVFESYRNLHLAYRYDPRSYQSFKIKADPGEVSPTVVYQPSPRYHISVQFCHLAMRNPGDELHSQKTRCGQSRVRHFG